MTEPLIDRLREAVEPFARHLFTDEGVVDAWVSLQEVAPAEPHALAAAIAGVARDADESATENLASLLSTLDSAVAAALVQVAPEVAARLIDSWDAAKLPPAIRANWLRACTEFDPVRVWEHVQDLIGRPDPDRWLILADLLAAPATDDWLPDRLFEVLATYEWATSDPSVSGVHPPAGRYPAQGAAEYESAYPVSDARRVRAHAEVALLDAAARSWFDSGRDPLPWLSHVGRRLAGCGEPVCCGPSLFEHELARAGYYLRRNPPILPR